MATLDSLNPGAALETQSLQTKRFRTTELPLNASQRTSVDNLLHAIKKKGAFDNVRKRVWSQFAEDVGVCKHIPMANANHTIPRPQKQNSPLPLRIWSNLKPTEIIPYFRGSEARLPHLFKEPWIEAMSTSLWRMLSIDSLLSI